MRQRFFVFVSVMYMLLGGVMLIRSLWAQVVPVAILGVVFVALGAVRLRDYFRQGERRP